MKRVVWWLWCHSVSLLTMTMAMAPEPPTLHLLRYCALFWRAVRRLPVRIFVVALASSLAGQISASIVLVGM